MKRPPGILSLILLAGGVQLAGPPSAAAQTDDPCVVTGAETVRTDRPHYLPFEAVSITGRGYGPSCTFTVEVAGPAGASSVPAVTDGSGNLAVSYDLGVVTGAYTVSVLSPGGGTAAKAGFTSGTYVMVDRAEFAPLDPVAISGRGWQPGETVSLVLREEPATHPERTLTATADTTGSFVNTEFSPEQHDAGVAFTLTARGALATAQTAFGDSAVAFDSASSGTSTGDVATSVTFPHTIGNGNNRLLVVAISTRPNAPTNVKYGGVAMNSAGAFTNPNVTPRPRVEFFYLTNPPTGTANVTYSITAGSVAGSVSFSGVYQPVPFGSSAGSFGTSPGCATGVLSVCGSPQPSVTVLNGPNDLILDALSISVGTGTSSVAAAASQTKQWDIRQGGPTVKLRGTGSTRPAAPGATNVSWTLSASGGDGSPQWVLGVLPIQAVAPATRLIVTTSAAATIAGNPISVTVTAQDQFFNTATTYAGTVQFTSTDAQAVLPADYTFVPGDNGVHTFTGVILATAGAQAVTATDADNGTVAGTSSDVMVGNAPLDHLALTPAVATITFGGSQQFAAEGFDHYNNSLGDVTASTTFSSSPDGACAGTVCTPGSAGAHLVTGNDGGKTGTASLQVDKANQVITFAALAGKTFGDADFSVGATASSGLAVLFAASGNCSVAGALVHLTGAGSCTITAQQPGNANYSSAADVPQAFSIAKAGQTITFGALAGKTFGDADFSVGATASSGLAVSFTASGNCSISGALVHVGDAGSCTITSQQSGDSNYLAAADVPQTFAIAKAGQTITFGVLAGKTYGDADFAVAATASSGLAVTFTASGNCSVAGALVHLGDAGSCTLTAHQAGNANYLAAADAPQAFSIAQASQTIAFGGLSGKTFGDPDFSVAATASSGLAVTFTASGNCSVAGALVHLGDAGSCTLTAHQAGNANYLAAADASQAFSIAQASQTIALGPLAGKTFGDADFGVAATATSGLPVSFTASGNCSVAGALVHLTGAGSCTLTAHQAGNLDFSAASDASQSFSIAQASQTIAFGALPATTFGDPDFGVSATASSGLAVSFTASGNCSVAGGLVHLTGPGSCTVTAHQAGNANTKPAPDVSQSFPIATGDSLGPIVSNPLAGPNPAPVNAPIALTATVSDLATGGSNIASARYRIDGGPSVSMSAADSAFDSATEAVTATLPGFAAAGIHGLCIQGTDSAGNTGAEECFLLAVFDATGGFVTGGGWIASPAGASTANPTLSGKANFAFNSKYETGQPVPTGATQLQFQSANFKFASTSYEWLVISGDRAQYKGSGTVGGNGKYAFVVTAIDGKQPGGSGIDLVRLKVYDPDHGNVVVYDTQPGAPDTADPTTPLGGGSIVIHK